MFNVNGQNSGGRVGPDIWGLENRANRPKYFQKKGHYGLKTGLQKQDLKEFFPRFFNKSVISSGRKGTAQNTFAKGVSDPKTGLKKAKWLSGLTL